MKELNRTFFIALAFIYIGFYAALHFTLNQEKREETVDNSDKWATKIYTCDCEVLIDGDSVLLEIKCPEDRKLNKKLLKRFSKAYNN